MKASFLLVLFAATALAAPIPKELKQAKDDELIVGSWKQESLSVRGQPPQNNNNGSPFHFTAEGKCASTHPGNNLDATYKLDQTETPRRMTWNSGPGSNWQCVYELNGDKLVLAFVETGTELPKKIEPAANLTIYHLTRIKE